MFVKYYIKINKWLLLFLLLEQEVEMMSIIFNAFIWICLQPAVFHIVSAVKDYEVIKIELAIDVSRRGFF